MNTLHPRALLRPIASASLAALLAATAMSGCAPLLIGGAMVGGTMMAVDRRTAGAQVEDQTIEIKAGIEAGKAAPSAHLNTTSYNRMLLITGEAASEADRKAIEQAAGRIENLRSVVNEVAVMGNTSISARSNDTIITGKVKAAFIDAKDLQAQSLKVVTERGIVYLMGVVTEREANRASDVTRAVGGVQKVVRVFEVISEAELAALQPKK